MTATLDDMVVLEVRDLKVWIRSRRGFGKAVDGATFSIHRGETLAIVGESGSGKSLTALALIGLHPRPASEVIGGAVFLDGENLLTKSEREIRRYRGRRIAIVLQDPLSALNPVLTILDQVGEAIRVTEKGRGRSIRDRSIELLTMLRIPAPAERLSAYPHQMSGGMLQRIVSAIALTGDPELLIADEPTTSLDVTVQAAYLKLLKDLQREKRIAVLLITHDFGVVANAADRVAVMYAGRIVETGLVGPILQNPAHPYTRALLKSVPSRTAGRERLPSIPGDPPSIYSIPPGCPFAARCPSVLDRCRIEYPPTVEVGPQHNTACWLHVK